MKRRSLTRLFNLFAILLLSFSLFSPVSMASSTNTVTKADQFSKLSTIKNLVESQENKLQRKGEISPSLQKKLNQAGAQEKIDIIVQLSEAPVSLQQAKSQLEGKSFSKASVENTVNAQQDQVTRAFKSKDIPFTLKNSFNRLINALVLEVNAGDIAKIADLKGVARVELDAEVQAVEVSQADQVGAHMDNSNNHLGIPAIWATGNEGQGITVGVVDSGIDYNHPD